MQIRRRGAADSANDDEKRFFRPLNPILWALLKTSVIDTNGVPHTESAFHRRTVGFIPFWSATNRTGNDTTSRIELLEQWTFIDWIHPTVLLGRLTVFLG